jgi:hypothetical protein
LKFLFNRKGKKDESVLRKGKTRENGIANWCLWVCQCLVPRGSHEETAGNGPVRANPGVTMVPHVLNLRMRCGQVADVF